jgi:DNA-binding CsgD family transcriptional regulator
VLSFNSSLLRYKFIYLTKNVYDGIAVHSLFEDLLLTSEIKHEFQDGILFHLIDKYVDFIPFSLRFISAYKAFSKSFESDIIFSAKWLGDKRVIFSNVLFFVDMYKPDKTSMIYFEGRNDLSIIKDRLDIFLMHCYSVIKGNKKNYNSCFQFTLREQQIVYHLLQGLSIKEISRDLGVSDKLIYKDRDALIRKLIMQQDPCIYIRDH